MRNCYKMKAQFDIALSAVKGDEAELWRRMAILTPKDFPDTKLWVQVRGLLEMSRLPIHYPASPSPPSSLVRSAVLRSSPHLRL